MAVGLMNRRLFLKASCIAAASLLFPSVLLGCREEKEGYGVAIVFGQHANARSLRFDNSFRTLVDDVISHGGYLALVLAQSRPEFIREAMMVEAPINHSKQSLEHAYLEDEPFIFLKEIDSSIPTSPEVDYLKSIKYASDALRSEEASKCVKKTIHIYGSGLSTSGEYLNFTDEAVREIVNPSKSRYTTQEERDEYAKANIERFVKIMINDWALPDLSGIHIVWHGFGEYTAEPQKSIPSPVIKYMKLLWAEVLKAANADSEIDFNGGNSAYSTSSNLHTDGFPPVQVIDFEENRFDIFDGKTSIDLPDAIFHFQPNSADYIETDETIKILDDYSKALITTCQEVVILGTTAAFGTPEECKSLGFRRAERIRDEFTIRGVRPETMQVASAGMEGVAVKVGDEVIDYYHYDLLPDGGLDEAKAQQNRAVHIVKLEAAEDILARFS